MARAASIIAKANKLLKATSSFDRTVYTRTTTTSGGDSLLGRYGSVVVTDTLMSPQPYVNRLGRERIPGGHAMSETLVIGSNVKIADDYEVLVTASMLTLSQIQNQSTLLVFKDKAGLEEVLVIHDYEQVSIEATDVAFTLYCRSTRNQ